VVHVRTVLAGAAIVKVIRDCPIAKWFPSRHRYALTRLVFFICAKFGKPPRMDVDHLMLSINRDQSAIEHYTISILIVIITTCYLYVTLPLVAAFLVATLLIQGAITLGGFLVAPLAETDDHLRLNSFFLMTLMIMASTYVAARPSPMRYVAWAVLALVALNAIAWGIMKMLRHSVRELEQRCGE
jgi:hypothetical protein